MTVGFFSPMPSARTGVAEYSAALYKALQPLGPVRLNDARADICLYHIGNNQLHRAIYEQALRRPGVVVLHDAVLHHFLLGILNEREYIREFVYNYGEWSAEAAARLWGGRALSAMDAAYFERPMLRRLAERSKAVIVHNPAAARMVRQHAAGAAVFEIPHLYEPPPDPSARDVIQLREHFGIAPQTFLFGVFGHLRESKRLFVTLRAFDTLRRHGVDIALLIAGEFASSDLRRALAPQLRRERVLRVGYIPERDLAGETSGIAIRLMGAGKPVLVTAGEEAAEFPAAAVIPIDCGLSEEEMLAAAMLWLADNRRDARDLGAIAREHILRCHRPDRVAELYWNVLQAAARSVGPTLN
jgi:glycosyltransferase involved in cell wall biosynthesis